MYDEERARSEAREAGENSPCLAPFDLTLTIHHTATAQSKAAFRYGHLRGEAVL